MMSNQKKGAQKAHNLTIRKPKSLILLYFNGAPERTRTSNPRLRRPMLYPVELQAQ